MTEEQYVIFSLGDEYYAIPILDVKEIILYKTPTKIPSSIEALEGVINLRGNLLTVINLGEKLDIKTKTNNEKRIIIIDTEKKHVGFTVDNVTEVLKFQDDDIEPPPSAVSKNSSHIKGIIKKDTRLLILIDIQALFNEY